MSFESGAETEGGQIPQADISICTGGSCQKAIWAHGYQNTIWVRCDIRNLFWVSLQSCKLSSRSCVPHAHIVMTVAARKKARIVTRAHCDTSDITRECARCVKKLQGPSVPQLHGSIRTAGYKQRAAQRETGNFTWVWLHACQLLTSGNIPHANALINASEYSRFPSKDTTQAFTLSARPLNWITGCCSASKRHNLRLLSQLPDTKELPSGVTAKQLTHLEWAFTEASCWPVVMSHSSTEPLLSPESSRSASTVAARQMTDELCPWRERMQLLDSRSHCFTASSSLAENKVGAAKKQIQRIRAHW